MKKFLCLMLALTLTASAGCAKGKEEGPAADVPADDPGVQAAENVPAETEEAVRRSADLLPAADFGGADYVIIGREYAKLGALPSIEFATEEMNGEIINDTVYRRNRTVEDNFNVRIAAMTGSAASLVPVSVAAGDGAYDLAWAHVNDMSSLSLGGNLANYYDVPHIDLAGAWWNQLAVESLTWGGKCFLQMNYIPFTGVLLSHCLYYDQKLAADYGVSDLYGMVNGGTWTFDRFDTP